MTSDLAERLTLWVGPIVVKEVRQGLRSKVFSIFFGLVLVVCLVLALVATAKAARQGAFELGRTFLSAYLIALGVVTLFIIPFGVFRSMLREREDETWVLLVLTGVGSRQIIRGKWASALSQSALFASACAPFVLFSYFLNGVDLLQIVAALAVTGALSCFITAVALALACQANSRAGRTGTQLAALVLLLFSTALGLALVTTGAINAGHDRGLLDFISILGLVALGSTQVVLEGAAAAIALPTEAASRGPRLALTWLVGVFLVAAVPVFHWLKADTRVAIVGTIGTSLYLVIAGAFAISERDGWPRRFRDLGWLRPGALRSYALIVGLLALGGVVWGAIYLVGEGRDRYFNALIAAPSYPILYLSLGVIAGRTTPLRALTEPRATRLGFVVVTAVGIVVPPLIALLVGRRPYDRDLNMLNPIFGLIETIDHRGSFTAPAVLVSATIAAVGVAMTVLTLRDLERPL